MEQFDRIEYNRLCAEFLGGKLSKMEAPLNPQWFDLPFSKKGIPEGLLKFDSDWNWTMKVVEKIERTKVSKSSEAFYEALLFFKIKTAIPHQELVTKLIWEFLTINKNK